MPSFCTHCNNNWSRLTTVDDEVGEEQYDVCPVCRTDTYLVEGKEGDTVAICAFTGKIFNPATGLRKQVIVTDHPLPATKTFDREAWEKKQEEKESAENAALHAYTETHALYGQEAALQAYHNVLNKQHATD